MKKITIMTLLLFLVLFGMYFAAHDTYALDAPHDATNSITCNSQCHVSGSPTPTWLNATGIADDTVANNLCWSCHNPSSMTGDMGDIMTHSSAQTSTTYGTWNMECRTCHDPHLQEQLNTYASTTLNSLVTGTIKAIYSNSLNPNWIQVNTALTPSIYTDYIVVPNIARPTTFYRIIGNTADTIYVSQKNRIDTFYIKVGNTFAIRYNGLVKSNMPTPSNGLLPVQFFNNTGPSSFASSSVTPDGVCQVCHTQTKYFRNDGSTFDSGHPAAGGTNCMTCHKHSAGFKADCNQCHGSPPVNATKGGATGGLAYISDATPSTTGSTLAGAHDKHANALAIACNTCHKGYDQNGKHNNGPTRMKIKMGFSLFGGTYVGGSYDGQSSASYTTGDGITTVSNSGSLRCSNVYCHSTVQANGGVGAPTYTTPVWNGTAPCGSCHRTTAAAGGLISSGNHTQHLSYTTGNLIIQCENCHTGAGDGTAYAVPTHVNNSIDVADGYTMGGDPRNGYGTCGSATACHGSGSPTWGMDVTGKDKCTVCHGTPTNGALGSSGADMAPVTGPKVGAHQQHLNTSIFARAIRCNECHTVPATIVDAEHINDGTPGAAEVIFSAITSTLSHTNGANPAYSLGTCNNVYCHGAAMPKFTANGANMSPSWTDTGYITGDANHDCAQCHGYPPAALSVHNGMGAATCHGCHSDVNIAGNGFDTLTQHVDGTLQVSGCTGCHGASDTTGKGAPLIASDLLKVATGHTVGMHARHIKTSELGYSCDTCHDQNGMPTLDSKITMSFKPTGLPSGGTYLGTAFTGTFSYTYSSNVTVTNNAKQTCSNLYCHGGTMLSNGGTDTTPDWADSTTGACGACHGATPANPPALGAHVKHAASTTGAGYQVACTTCHVNNATQHVDGKSEVAFDPANTMVNGGSYSGTDTMLDAYGGCSNIYCHSQGNGSAPLVTNFTWTSTLTCAGCHGNAVGNLTTGKHTKHLTNYTFTGAVACTYCHNGTTTTGTTITDKTKHVNKTTDVAWDAMNNVGSTYSAAAKNCSNIYCHSQGTTGGAPYSSANTTANWTITLPTDCTGCHSGSNTASVKMSTGSHGKHVQSANQGCVLCHSATVSNNTTIGTYANHVNDKVNIAFDSLNPSGLVSGLATTAKNPGTAAVNCSNLYCHAGGNPTWGIGGPLACNSCHAASNSLLGKHSVHYGTTAPPTSNIATNVSTSVAYVFNCGACHDATLTTHAGGEAQSGLRAAEVVFNALYARGTSTYLPGSTITGTDNNLRWTAGASNNACTNIYCHSQGNGSAPLVTNFTWTTSLTCAGCHGNAVGNLTTGKHTKHLTSYTYTGSVACTYCHNATTTTGTTITDKTKHVNKTSDIAWDAMNSAGASYGSPNCSNLYCHSQGTSSSSSTPNTSANWGATLPADCSGCHGGNSAAGTKITSGSHGKHVVSFSMDCKLCHNATTATDSRTISNYANHVNKKVDVAFDTSMNPNGLVSGLASTAKTPGTASAKCSNLYCHSSGQGTTSLAATPIYSSTTLTWGNSASGACGTCHAVLSPVISTGSHSLHLNTSASGAQAQCGSCHTGAGNGSSYASANHVNKLIDVSYGSYTAGGAAGNGYGSCATSNCHGTMSPVWGNNTSVDQCTKCHGTPTASPAPDYAKAPPYNTGRVDSGQTSTSVGAHQAHLRTSGYRLPIACNECHKVPANVTDAGHMSGLPATVTFLYSTLATTHGLTSNNTPTYTAANATCSAVYCHDGAYFKNGGVWSNGTDTTPRWTDTAFLNSTPTTTADCNKCHGYPPAGGHPQDTGCSGCHSHVAGTTSFYPAGTPVTGGVELHMNGKVEGGGDACLDCHKGLTSGAHMKHTSTSYLVSKSLTNNDYGAGAWWFSYSNTGGSMDASCGFCHPSTSGTHRNGTKNIDLSSTDTNTWILLTVKSKNSATQDYTQNTGVSVVCNSTYCHSTGYDPGSGLTYTASPDWYGSGFTGDACAGCHGNSPTGSTAHSAHVVGIHYDDIYTNSSGLTSSTGAAGGGAGHGDPSTSTTMNCNLCHSSTVATTSFGNDKNSVCVGCHTGANLKGTMVIAPASTSHINGSVEVSFAAVTVRSKAQLRDSITTVADVSTYWTRSVGYKSTSLAHDDTKAASNSAAAYTAAGGKTCSNVACHNGNSVKWTDTVTCNSCHTDLPQ